MVDKQEYGALFCECRSWLMDDIDRYRGYQNKMQRTKIQEFMKVLWRTDKVKWFKHLVWAKIETYRFR